MFYGADNNGNGWPSVRSCLLKKKKKKKKNNIELNENILCSNGELVIPEGKTKEKRKKKSRNLFRVFSYTFTSAI